MKIGVISDTHIPTFTNKLPQKVLDRFRNCDLIIHAGDAVEMSVIQDLEKIAETRAVWGNMDSLEMKEKLPEKLIFDVAGKKIGVTHGRGASFKVLQNVSECFDPKPDIIIFGHSHASVNEVIDGTLFFNPGSATDEIFSKNCTFGIIEIDGDDIRGEIIKVN